MVFSIFAIGFRNPWRYSFDRGTGQLFVADVGHNDREEIDIVTLGGKKDWRVFEGNRCTNLGPVPWPAASPLPLPNTTTRGPVRDHRRVRLSRRQVNPARGDLCVQ
jgi:hypothetical protein